MRKIDEKIVKTLRKTGKKLDSLSLNDSDAWKESHAVLNKLIKGIPKKKMSELNKLLCLCMEGVQEIYEKSAPEPLSLVDAIFEGLNASQEYLLENEDGKSLVRKAGKELAKVLKQNPDDWDPPAELIDGSITESPCRLTLDDAAALLIQVEPDDIPGLAKLHETLETIDNDQNPVPLQAALKLSVRD